MQAVDDDDEEQQQETEVIESPDVESPLGSIDEITQIEQSKSLIQSLLIQQTDETDNGKKKKKKIKTGRQKALERLTKATKTIFTSPEQLNAVCERINSLLSSHKTILLPVCHSLDKINSGRLPEEQFRLVIRDRLPEMSSEDFFVLTKLFEIDGSIDYRMMLEERSGNGILRFITSLAVPQSKEPLQSDLSKYVTVHLRFLTFDSYNAYPGHIYLTVSDQTSIYTLSKMIIDETDFATRSISIFREKVRLRTTLLDPMCSLDNSGYTGAYKDGTHHQSFPSYTLYYDYTPLERHVHCPILKCDYYMR